MRRISKLLVLAAFSVSGFAQTYPYIVRTFAGSWPLGDGGRAEDALLYSPRAAVPDNAGNLFILDAAQLRIRKIDSNGRISTFASLPLFGYDMKRGADGTLYVSGSGGVVKVSPAGVVSILAAEAEAVGEAYGVAVDPAGVVYFSDVSKAGDLIRQIGRDGVIRTVAGSARGFSGDRGAALNARFSYPSGLAIDSTGAIYVADYGNSRVRKFTVGGPIETVAGNGNYSLPIGGAAIGSGMGTPNGIFIDSRDNLYIADSSANCIIRVSAVGALLVIAGNFNAYIPIEDGKATSSSLRYPSNVSADAAGNIFVVDETHRVRRIADGFVITIGGKLHFAGDNGPATAAVMNEPEDIAFDPQGNAYILDSSNYLIRKVTPAGVISTYVGKQNPGVPSNGATLANAPLPYLRQIAIDAKGVIYVAGNLQIFKIADGSVNLFAGTGASGNSGDGGRATQATFSGIGGMALDSAGNVYVSDSNRVRVISPDGVISAFAGSGTRGRAGDGSLATSAQFNFTSRAPLAVDREGNVYISDAGNFSVRMVDRQGLIYTAVGNGSPGRYDGVSATTAFGIPGALAFDPAGNLHIATQIPGEIYRLSGGVVRRIVGAGDGAPVDGALARDVTFLTRGMKIDANGDIYCVDLTTSTVRRLVINSPTRFTIADGDAQSAVAGQALPKLLKVQLMGRAGFGVTGVTVNFAVKSGDARLSATSAPTDTSGFAGVSVTLGPTAGPVVITATAAGTNMPAVEFTATATRPPATCSVPPPAVTSVRSAGDFGGSSTFASGSWLEIKGSQLAETSRSWAGGDFNGANAPTTLDGVTVTINGRRAFVGYISPEQINVQAPADSATGPLALVVTKSGCPSDSFTVQKAAVAGGLLAPSAFNVGGTQYAAALYQDGFTFVGRSDLIAGVPFRAAAPGDAITLYGIGFGDVAPSIAPGTIVSAANSIPGLTISFGATPATVTYAGLAPNAVGLYQFNVTVPNVPAGDHRIVVRVNGAEIQQTAHLTVR